MFFGYVLRGMKLLIKSLTTISILNPNGGQWEESVLPISKMATFNWAVRTVPNDVIDLQNSTLS